MPRSAMFATTSHSITVHTRSNTHSSHPSVIEHHVCACRSLHSRQNCAKERINPSRSRRISMKHNLRAQKTGPVCRKKHPITRVAVRSKHQRISVVKHLTNVLRDISAAFAIADPKFIGEPMSCFFGFVAKFAFVIIIIIFVIFIMFYHFYQNGRNLIATNRTSAVSFKKSSPTKELTH